jgi:hypothetical protein
MMSDLQTIANMMKQLVIAAAALLMLSSPAAAGVAQTCQGKTLTPGNNTVLLCSKNFYAAGTCTGGDQVPLYTAPWEQGPITIIGTEITVFQGASDLQYAFTGNSVNADVMGMLGAGQSHGLTMFPAGYGFQFAPIGNMPHIDLHIACSSGPFQLFQTIYYTVP